MNDTEGINIAMLLYSITVRHATKWLIFFHFTVQAETNDLCAIQLINPKQFFSSENKSQVINKQIEHRSWQSIQSILTL